MVGMSSAGRYILSGVVVNSWERADGMLARREINQTVGDCRRFACQGPKGVGCLRRPVFRSKKVYEKTKSWCWRRFEKKLYRKSKRKWAVCLASCWG